MADYVQQLSQPRYFKLSHNKRLNFYAAEGFHRRQIIFEKRRCCVFSRVILKSFSKLWSLWFSILLYNRYASGFKRFHGLCDELLKSANIVDSLRWLARRLKGVAVLQGTEDTHAFIKSTNTLSQGVLVLKDYIGESEDVIKQHIISHTEERFWYVWGWLSLLKVGLIWYRTCACPNRSLFKYRRRLNDAPWNNTLVANR